MIPCVSPFEELLMATVPNTAFPEARELTSVLVMEVYEP
jgi:hypothetical protein